MDKIKILQKLLELYKQLLKMQENKNQAFYETGKANLGKVMAPIYKDFGCVEALNNIAKLAIGKPIGGGASTYLLYHTLKKNHKQVFTPEIGDIIISPSGYGSGKIPNGHTGIVSDNGKIMSNNSETLKWDEYYTVETWNARYKKLGGFPVYFYKII